MNKRNTARKTTRGPLNLDFLNEFMSDDESNQEISDEQNEIKTKELESDNDNQDDLNMDTQEPISLEETNKSSQSSDFIVSLEPFFNSNTNSNEMIIEQPTSSNYNFTQVKELDNEMIVFDNEIINLDNETQLSNTNSVEETNWISNECNTVHVFKYKFKNGLTDRAKIAAFDLDGTLITPKSNKKFSRDINDWKMLDGRLKCRISKLIDDDYSFVIFSNQMGISQKFVTLKQIKYKFRNVIQFINLPCVALFCTDLDKYRKPAIGMFEFYQTINRTKIDKQNSFFVGDSMGRLEDHNAADLLFAYNCKLPFISIQEFLNENEMPKLFTYDQLKQFRIPKFSPLDPKKVLPRIIVKENESGHVTEFCFIEELTRSIESFIENNSKSVVILLIGLFGSGKTFFFNNYLENLNYKLIEGNQKWQDEMRIFENYAMDDEIINKRIVIDKPNLNYEERKKYIGLAHKNGYEVFSIYFNLNVQHCSHLSRFRDYYFEPNRRSNQIDIMKQYLSMQPPQYDEGFHTIYIIDFLENFDDPQSKQNQSYYFHFLYSR